MVSLESVMPSNHLILCHPLLLRPSIFPSIGVFSNESVLRIRWPKYWSFSFSISSSNEYSGLVSFRMDWLDLLVVQGPLKIFSSTTVVDTRMLSIWGLPWWPSGKEPACSAGDMGSIPESGRSPGEGRSGHVIGRLLQCGAPDSHHCRQSKCHSIEDSLLWLRGHHEEVLK